MSRVFISWLVLLATYLTFVDSQDKRIFGHYGHWGAWSSCKLRYGPCGQGTQVRTRCFFFFFVCHRKTQSKSCHVPCRNPVHGNWATWSRWTTCSATCRGTQTRRRTCTNPAPRYGGRHCRGSAHQSQPCGARICPTYPVRGKWSPWSRWTTCSATCRGTQTRRRTCTNPRYRGRYCRGPAIQRRRCGARRCATKPPSCRPGQTVYDRCGQRCVCGAGGTLTQCTRIRKEFTSMTTAERQRYVRVIKTVSTEPARKRRYDELIGIHKRMFNGFGIHERQHFLTWHRWYILQYENLLREVDCHFTVSYWDWSVVSGNPWGTTASDVWYAGDSGLGGNGASPNQCVTTGPFRQGIWELVPSAERPRCLRRRFRGTPPDSVAVAELLDIPDSRFTDFEVTLRLNLHDNVHCLIGGTMCSGDSASAPEFFLHHAMVDKIWTDWQKKSHFHRRAFFHSVNEDLPGTGGRRPQQFVDNARLPGGVRVEYAEIGEGPVARTVRRLRALPPKKLTKIPRERFSRIRKQAIRLFRVSPADLRAARRMQRIIEPKVAIQPPKGSAIDRNLGFYHKAV